MVYYSELRSFCPDCAGSPAVPSAHYKLCTRRVQKIFTSPKRPYPLCRTVSLLFDGQSSPITGLEWPRGFQEVKVPRFHDNGTGWW